MLSNEEVRQIRDNTNTQIEANNAALLRQQEELHKALRETYGQDGVDTYNTFVNANAILARDDAPDALLWDSARESAKSYARWMKMPLPTSETLDDWNIERKPFANGREALERIVTIFQNPAAMFDDRYKSMAKAQAEGTLTPQSLVEMAQGAGYKAKDLAEIEIGQHLGKEDREAFEGLREAHGRATRSQSSSPSMFAGPMPVNPEQAAADIKAYQDALPGYLKKAQDAELAQRYQAETIANNALALWASAADGLSPASNELLRRAFVGGKDGIEIDNDLVKEHLRYLNKEGSWKTGWTAEQQALYRASMDSGDWSKVDNATLFAKIPREELDSVLMLMGAARGTLRESQLLTDTGRRVWESTKRPIEGVMDFFTFGYVHVDEATAEIAKRRNATALDVMASDTRQQIALRHALEDATAPLMYEDYGEASRAFMVALEQVPTMAYMVGVPALATMATGPIGGKAASAAVMSAYAMSYAADTREYALREGASLLSANLMGIGSGVMQALLESSKIEAFYGKGLTEAYFKAAMGSASKRMAQVLGGKIVGKYGSLELFKAALESGSAIAVNGALETIQEGLQKGAEEVSKNVALKIDGQDVRIFDGVQAAVSKEMADVAAGMFLTQASTSALGNVKNVAAGSALIKNMAILRGGLFQAMQQGAPISEARLNLMNSPEAQQEMKAKWLGLQNASRGERVNMLMRDYHLSNDEAMSVDSTMSAFKNIVNRNKAQAAQLIAEYVINGNSNIEPLLTQNGATSTVTHDNLAERFKAAFGAIGITDVEIEEATGINLGEKNEGKFVLKFGKGDVQYTFGIDNNMGDPASAGFATSAQEEMLRVGAPEANVSEVAFVSRWTRDEAFRDEMMKKYNLKAAGRYTPTRARLRAVDKDGNTYTADVDGIISLAIGERATTQTVVHETMHMLLRVVRDLEVIQGADSVMDETTKRTLLQAFSPNLLQQYDAAHKAGKDNFFELFLANAKAEEEFANLAMRGATTHNVTTAQEIISQSAKQNVSGAIDWLRMMGGKMLDAFLNTDEWRVVLDDNGLGALVEGLTGDVAKQQGVSHVIDTLSQGVLNATKAQDTYHEAREQERKARWDREALALRQRVQEAIQRKQALRQQMAQAEADAALYEQLEAEAVALDTEIAKAEEDFNAAIGEQAAADEAMRERAQAVAAYNVKQAQQQYARAMKDYAYYYREQIATLPKKANGKPDMTRAQRDRLSVEKMLVRDAKQAYREAVRKAAETGDPGAIYEARKLDIQEAFDRAVADTVTWLRGEEAVIDNTRVSNWENLGLTRVLGQFTLESKTAYIERRMREYGESREQSTAQADGLYPTDGGLSVPWLNRELYGDGTGGSSPDEVAQAMYNEGRISEPDAEVLWEAIRGDVESLQAYKTREKEHVRSQFVEAVEQMNEERARNLAYLESEAEMGRFMVSGTPSAEAVAQAQREYNEVVAQYTNHDGSKKPGWMKAPNGKPTNLTERQWVQVRTPSFKKWFGDWEKDAEVYTIVDVQSAPFSNVSAAIEWVKGNGVIGVMTNEETGGKGEINISVGSIREMLNPRQREKSVSAAAHFAALTKLREIIRESKVVESHPDYKKGADGKRSKENGINPDVEIDVLYGAIHFGDDVYRVKTRIKRYSQPSETSKAYSYQVSEIEVLPGTLEEAKSHTLPTDKTSITGNKLLQGVLNVNGNLILDHSKVVDENGEPLVVYHGTESGGFTEFIDTDDIGYFFTSSFDMARSYSGERGVYAPSRIISWDEALKEAETFGTAMIEGYAVENVNGRMVADSFYPSKEEVEANLTLNKGDKVVKAYRIDDGYDEGDVFLEKDLNEFVDTYARPQDAGLNYEVFLNLKDPLIVNGNGSNWDNVIDHVGTMVTYDELTDEQKERIAEEMGVDVDELEDYQVEDLPVFDIDNFDVRTPQRTRDWVSEAADMGCDGVIFKDIYDEGKFGYGTLSADVFVAMRANQIKSTENVAPTENDDIRYSIVSARRPDLVGLHNMSAEGLKGADDLGGFAMPSIAITRDSMGHNEFGDISLLMRTSAFNPQVNRLNKIYSRDAWTPTFPGIINKVDAARMVRVSERLLDTLPADLRKAYTHGDTYSLLYEDGVNDAFKTVNTAGEYYRHNAELKAAYLVAKGETLQPVMKQKSFLGRSSGRILALGEEGLRLINDSIGDLLVAFHSVPAAELDAWIEQHRGEIEAAFIDAAYASRVAKNPAVAEYSKEEIYGDLFKKNPLGFSDVIDLADAVAKLRKAIAKGEADVQTVDEYATKRAINERVSSDDADFIAWLDEQYGNPVLARGIRNTKAFYTPSGNRRSWDALHDPVTLSNVVKNMLSKQREQGEGFLGANPFGLAAAKLNSFKDVIKHEDLLKELPKEEMDAIRDEFIAAFNEISARYLNTWKYTDDNPFTASARSDEALLDAWAASKGSFAGLKRELNGYGRTASDDLIRDLQEVMNGIAKFPTRYFEAKPMRAVGFEEVAAAIIPDTTTEETREILARRGVPVYEYTAGNDTSRLAALNMAADDVEDTRFSVRAKASTEQLDLFMDYLPDYAKRHQLDAQAQQEMKSLAENAFKLSDETRDIWREALRMQIDDPWKKAWATEEANRGKYPTVTRTVLESYSGKRDFGAEVRGLQIASAEDIAMMMMALRSPYQELMKAVYLDKDKRVLDARVLTIGRNDQTVISTHLVFGDMPEGTESVILSHNHPSGYTEPSDPDINTTASLNAAAEAVGVKLLDHVITNGTTYYSFRDQTDHKLPESKQDKAAWEVLRSTEQNAIITPSRVEEIVRLVQQHGNETVLLGLDRRRCVEFVRLLPADLMLSDTAEAALERKREIVGYALSRKNVLSTILYVSPTDSYDREKYYAEKNQIQKSIIPLEFAAANAGVPFVDVIIRDDTTEPAFHSMRSHNELMLPKAKAKPMETGGSRYAVSARFNSDLSIPENAKAFKEYIKALPAAPKPARLKDGSPKTTLEWFEQNMVGKTYSFDIPGHGHFTFTPTMGHIGRLVCSGGNNPDGSKIVKGRIKKKYDGNWVDAVKRGDISASDVDGWNESRAVHLPLVAELLTSFDAVLRDKDDGRSEAFVFLKKFTSASGAVNTVVMRVTNDEFTLGPLSAHVTPMTIAWLNKKDLVTTSDGKVYNASVDNSASHTSLSKDNAESNSSDIDTTIPHSSSSVNENRYHVTSRPDLTQLNEQHAAAQARLAKAEKRMRKANTSYRIQSQAAMRDGFGAMPNVNDMVSHPMLEYTIGAIAMNSGHKVNPRDVQKFAKDFGLSVDARSAKESADRINESVWGKAGRASKMNKSLIMRGKQRSPFERLSALGAILESEANEPDREKRVQDEMAKIMGYARGAQSARTVSKDARILRETKAQEILAQTGYSAETIEQWCGFDLVDTILEMQDALSRMSKDDIAKLIERRNEEAEKRKARELEEAASGTELKSEITAEQQAIWEELQKRLVDLTRRRAALEEERRQKAKARRQAQKEAEANEEEPKQEAEEVDLEEATEDLIPQTFDVGGRTIDLMEPSDLVWFVENMVAYKMLQQEAATEADLATLSADEKYIRNVALTLGSVIERLANGMVYSHARENVMKAITDLGYSSTLRQVELIGIKALSTLHASRIRTQRKAIIKAMLEGGEVDVGSETITLTGIKQAVEKGRLVVGRSDLDRKVTGDVEARLKAIKKVIKAGDTEQARLEADARQKLEALGKTAGLDNEEIMRDYQDARRIQEALNTYGGLTHRTIAELVDIAEELSRQINGELEAHERRKAEAQAKHDADVQTVVAACAADAKKYKPTDDNKTWRERAADWLDRGNGLLNIVLGRIGRNTVGDVRNAWNRLSNDIQAKFAGSAQKERVLIDGYNARVAEIMKAAYGSQRNGVNRLNELIPEDLNEIITAQIQRDKDGNPIPGKQAHQKTRMTVGQVLQLWLSIKQQDYKDNAVLWGRDGAAFKAIESCLSAEDVAFASQAQKLLKDIFPELRETYRKIVGYSVGTTPDYWPVKIHMERDSRPADVRVYSPFVASMQPRTRHGLDFDESADALTMLTSRLNEYAHMQAYGEMAEELVALFGDHKLRRAIKNTYGDEYMAQLDAKLQDTLLGPRMQYSAIGSNLVALTSICSMGFNLNSVFKQLFSFGSMANRVGLRGMAKFFAENMFDFTSPEAEYLRNSTAWKSRYGKSTQNAVFEQLMRGTGKMSKASIVRNQIINAGFKPIMWADWLASRNVALGFFKMRKAQLVDEGMAEADAMERASVETIDLIETTMQTGQTHHQSQNSKSEMFKLLSQFQNALVQQGEYMKVDVAKILRGERGGWEGVGRTAARYAVTGALIQIANGILQAIYGDGIMDDDDEEAKQAWYAMCAEMVSSLFLPVTATPLVGGVATWAINYAVGESDTLNSYDLKNEFVPPAFSTIERTFSGAIDVGYAFAGEEDWAYALHKLGKAMSAPYRSAARFAEGQFDWEPPKKQR